MLEECGLAYNTVPVNIGRGDQFKPEFLKISPNNRMPAIVDHETGISIFESGAIFIYLAEKTGRFMPSDQKGRSAVLQWLFWQVGNLGPAAGQLSHFVNYALEPNPYALDRFRREYDRLLGVMDRQLAETQFLAGDYSIADMASYPWILPYKRYEVDLDKFVHLRRWFDTLKTRPAVRTGVDLGKDWRKPGPVDEEARKFMFGQTAESTSAQAHKMEKK